MNSEIAQNLRLIIIIIFLWYGIEKFYLQATSSKLCVGHFCLERCQFHENWNSTKFNFHTNSLAINTHCFLKLKRPDHQIFLKFVSGKKSESYVQVFWDLSNKTGMILTL